MGDRPRPRRIIGMGAVVVPVAAAIALGGCGQQRTGQGTLASWSEADRLPVLDPVSRRLERLGRRVAVVNDPARPAPDWVPRTALDQASAAGCLVSDRADCDLLIVCRTQPRRSMDGLVPPRRAYAITSTLEFHELMIERMSDSYGAVPGSRWLATVEIDLDRWKGPFGEVDRLRGINIRVGTQGVRGPDFGQTDLLELRQVLEAWARTCDRRLAS